jgi:hypothetical protein
MNKQNMKSIQKLCNGILAVLIIFPACTKIYINEISQSPGFNVKNENSKTAFMVSIDRVYVQGVSKAFDKKYNKNRDFVNDYAKIFTNRFEVEKIFSQVKTDTSSQWNLMKSLAVIPGDFTSVDSLFNHCNADYLICLSDFEVYNYFTKPVTQNFGNMNGPTFTSSQEFCVVQARIQIYNTKSRKIELEYLTKGEKKVILLQYQSALISAMNKSIDHAVAYMKTGKKDF